MNCLSRHVRWSSLIFKKRATFPALFRSWSHSANLFRKRATRHMLKFIHLYLHTATLPTSIFKFNWTQWLFIEITVEGNHYTVYSSKHVSRRFPATILSGSLWWAIFFYEIHLQWIMVVVFIILDWIFVLTEQNQHDSLQAQGNWPSIVTHVWFPLFRIQNQLPSAIVILVIYNRLFQTPPLFWTDFFLPWFQINPV